MADYIKLVESTINALRLLSENHEGLGVREISRLLEMNKSTSHRLLLTLQKEGLVEFDELTQKYRMTLGILQLINKIPQKSNLISASLPYMEELRDLTKETVALHIRVLNYRLVVAKVESNLELRWSPLIGKPYPLYQGAASKVISAFLPQKAFTELLESLPDEITDEEYVCQIEGVKKQKYSISYGEIEPGGIGIAAPIFNHLNEFVGAISVYAIESRTTQEKVNFIIQEVTRTVKQISKSLY
jgi:IclR family transcriptional regulator, KDG regulon repressor